MLEQRQQPRQTRQTRATMNNQFQQEWRETVTHGLDELTRGQAATGLQLQRIEGRLDAMMPREAIAEAIAGAVATRVSIEQYRGEMALIDARIKRVEAGPESWRTWLVTAFGAVGCLASVGGIISVIVSIVAFFLTRR